MATITLRQIGSQIEAQLAANCGSPIDWTFRTADRYTISGDTVAVNRAVLFCIENGIAQIESDTVYDAETDESYAYLKAVGA